MSVLNPVSTVTLPHRRPTEDPDGNKVWTGDPTGPPALPSLQAVVSLSAAGSGSSGNSVKGDDRFFQAATLFVPRGSDVLAGDEVVYNGHAYKVIGYPRGDQDHPFTGDDFGWVVYSLAGGG